MKYLGKRRTDLRQIHTVWSLARTSLNVNVKDQGYQEKTAFFGPVGGLRAVNFWYNIFGL